MLEILNLASLIEKRLLGDFIYKRSFGDENSESFLFYSMSIYFVIRLWVLIRPLSIKI